ncbi:Uncharacterised protein [Mycobacterium tuberculosis]|nr:Uncharacterised protein [Mycobacterium tuberculosis]
MFTLYLSIAASVLTASQRASNTSVAPVNSGKIRPKFSPAIQNSGKNDRKMLSSLDVTEMP